MLFKRGRGLSLLLAVLCLLPGVRAASLQTFAPLYAPVTNDIAFILGHFDNSFAQKQKLAALTRARSVMLDDTTPDEQALAALLKLLGSDAEFAAALDACGGNARGKVLARYDLFAALAAELPPSPRAGSAQSRFNSLAADRAALAAAPHAAGISALLSPFGRRLDVAARLVLRAQIMPRPNVGRNALRAVVDGHAFISTRGGAHSPNAFNVSAPGGLYYEVSGLVVDGSMVINFSLPIVTDQVRYEVASGLAALTYTPDVFATNAVRLAATNGTFFVQSDSRGREIYGVFSCAGPGLEVKDGRFRIEIPRGLRGP